MGSVIVTVGIDWSEAYGWECPFCGGEIDHLDDEDDEDGTVYASYACQTAPNEQRELCANSFFVVHYDPRRRGDNGDSLTLDRFIQISVEERYVNVTD